MTIYEANLIRVGAEVRHFAQKSRELRSELCFTRRAGFASPAYQAAG
jgi:hypothetical protein